MSLMEGTLPRLPSSPETRLIAQSACMYIHSDLICNYMHTTVRCCSTSAFLAGSANVVRAVLVVVLVLMIHGLLRLPLHLVMSFERT